MQPLIELRRFPLARLCFRRSNFAVVFYLGERRAERNSEVVQCDQGLRLHSARRRWKQRRFRPYLCGGKGGLQFAGRGREGILRCCAESRKGIGGKSAAELGRRFTPAGSADLACDERRRDGSGSPPTASSRRQTRSFGLGRQVNHSPRPAQFVWRTDPDILACTLPTTGQCGAVSSAVSQTRRSASVLNPARGYPNL